MPHVLHGTTVYYDIDTAADKEILDRIVNELRTRDDKNTEWAFKAFSPEIKLLVGSFFPAEKHIFVISPGRGPCGPAGAAARKIAVRKNKT